MVEKINKAILRLMLQEPFYYYIFSNIDIEYTNNQEMKDGATIIQFFKRYNKKR